MSKLNLNDTDGIDGAVWQTVGAASMAWENVSGAGVFDEKWANACAVELKVWINKNYTPKAKS